MKSWDVAAPSCNAFLHLFFLLLNVSDNHIFVCTLKLVSWELLVFPLSSTGVWSWTWRTWSVWILTGHLHWAGTDCHHCVWYYSDKPGHFRWKDKTPGRPELSRCVKLQKIIPVLSEQPPLNHFRPSETGPEKVELIYALGWLPSGGLSVQLQIFALLIYVLTHTKAASSFNLFLHSTKCVLHLFFLNPTTLVRQDCAVGSDLDMLWDLF